MRSPPVRVEVGKTIWPHLVDRPWGRMDMSSNLSFTTFYVCDLQFLCLSRGQETPSLLGIITIIGHNHSRAARRSHKDSMCEVLGSGLAPQQVLGGSWHPPVSLKVELLGARTRLCPLRQGALQGWAGVHGGSVGMARSIGTSSVTARKA